MSSVSDNSIDRDVTSGAAVWWVNIVLAVAGLVGLAMFAVSKPAYFEQAVDRIRARGDSPATTPVGARAEPTVEAVEAVIVADTGSSDPVIMAPPIEDAPVAEVYEETLEEPAGVADDINNEPRVDEARLNDRPVEALRFEQAVVEESVAVDVPAEAVDVAPAAVEVDDDEAALGAVAPEFEVAVEETSVNDSFVSRETREDKELDSSPNDVLPPAIDAPSAEVKSALDILRDEELALLPGLSSRIGFAPGEVAVTGAARSALDSIFNHLFVHQETDVSVTVFGIEGDDLVASQRLAQRRAARIVGYLVRRGLAQDRFSIRTQPGGNGREAPGEQRVLITAKERSAG